MGRKDVKQAELARRMGENDQWVSTRLRARTPIDLNDLLRFARALEVDPYELLPPADAAAAAVVAPKRRYQARRDRGTPRDTRPAGYPAHPAAHRTAVPRAA